MSRLERKLFQDFSDAIEQVNKTFSEGNFESNDTKYKEYRDVLAIVVIQGYEVNAEEYWQDKLVCLKVTIGGVSF